MAKTIEKPKLVDLFSGAGGLTLGFVQAGFEPIYAIEHDSAFAQTYATNFGCHVDSRPIEEAINDKDVQKIRADIVIGGPPCQGFSNLGPNRADDPRRALWQYYIDVVKSTRCKVFVMENVPNLLTSEEGAEIIRTAEELGFEIRSGVLLASQYGVPQNRKRAFIIGSKIGAIELPEPTGEVSTVRDAFKGIPAKPTVHNFVQNGPVPTEKLHIARNPTELSKKRYALIPPGGNRFDLQRLAPELTPQCWIKKTQGGTDLYGRLEWNGPARCTIRTEFYKPEKGRYLHPKEDRPITHWEAARLQTFPDDFLWCGSKIKIAIQIGNAVPPKLSNCIAKHIAKNISIKKTVKRKRVRVAKAKV
ncbi:DNA cytosine methyltransferase [Gimesia chilikensis]|uniref:DNA cytosine methyltransferase n=1 Tax=Gimesia chilikensis TaxID=2605989 RepID=UPI0011EE3B14|nr:DNA cytosine methyltransferase [Gimesia chilikensis]KAA0141017.1 DNA cytosine methyltransferase [Gimesia chilikensis]